MPAQHCPNFETHPVQKRKEADLRDGANVVAYGFVVKAQAFGNLPVADALLVQLLSPLT